MTKFRKKPVVIDAIQYQWDGFYRTIDQAQDDIADFMESNVSIIGQQIEIPTLEGVMMACRGDWIIRGTKGDLYPCKPDVFEATYELAE